MTIWDGVDRLIDAAQTLEGLRAHGLHLLAARRWRQRHRPVPDALIAEHRTAAMRELAMVPLLGRIRNALEGPVLVIKGPEVAARYPEPSLRPYRDLDILVPYAGEARRVLLSAGFVSTGSEEKYADHHHQAPLFWPGLPFPIELHESFWAPPWTTFPPLAELFANAIPSRLGVPGVLTLPAVYHPVLIAAHAWHHVPLRRVLDLVDVAVMADELDAEDLEAVARRLNLERVWQTTVRAIDYLLLDKPVRSWPLRLWARHLPEVKDRSVRRQRLTRWLGACWAPHPTTAATYALEMMRDDTARARRGIRHHITHPR